MISDGNGGLYIRRTLVEKAIITAAGTMLAAFFGLMGWLGVQTYGVLREQNDELIRLGARLEAVALQSAENSRAIDEHDRWARDQRDDIYREMRKKPGR